mgnify:CR=1 FL=1
MIEGRSKAFWFLAIFFGLYVLFLYGPMIAIYILSFQGPQGGLHRLGGVSEVNDDPGRRSIEDHALHPPGDLCCGNSCQGSLDVHTSRVEQRHGGGGIAAFNGGSLAIAGGYITGNYSAEAGGGVYAGAWDQALSGFTFSGGIIASNVAQNSEGGGIRITAPTVGEFNVSGKKAYITNNTTNTTNDWGGGGVFVQGSSEQGIKSARVRKSLVRCRRLLCI